ncbi:MAG: WD40/YVTN/BNR-like repeat-containing protein [Geminicoccaceae bacterium]
MTAAPKTALRSFRDRLPCVGALVLAVGLVAVHGIASARNGNEPRGAVVALAYEAGSDALLKAYPRALYRSSDSGRGWTPVPLPSSVEDGSIAAVATPAEGQGVLYVAGPGLGVLRSEDNGGSWIAQNDGLPSRDVVAFATHADQPDTLYALIADSGIYRSQDAGKSWRLMDRGPQGTRQLMHSDMEGSMETGWLYAATAQGVRVSMDCFCLWRDAGELTGGVHSVVYDPQQPEHLYAAAEQGLFRSTNGGQEWEATSPGPDVTALALTPSGVLYAATGDGALFRSVDRADTWERIGA